MASSSRSVSVGAKSKVRYIDKKDSRIQCLRNILTCGVIVSQNYLGVPTSPFTATAEQLYSYVLELCDELPDEIKKVAETKHLIKQVPQRNDIELKTRIIKLTSEDTYSEYPYRFCRLWINEDTPSYTSVQQWTKQQSWDETFVFDISDYEHDVMHYELWMSKTLQFSRANLSRAWYNEQKRKHFHRLYDIFCRVCSSIKSGSRANLRPRLVGEVTELVQAFPSSPDQIVLHMTGKKKDKRIRAGDIVVEAELSTKRTYSYLYHFRLHLSILKMCYEKHLESFESESLSVEATLWKSWTEILTVPALTLIHQHAIQNGLDAADQTLCSLLVTTALKEGNENRISYSLIRSLLEELQELTRDKPLQDTLAKSYRKSIHKFFRFAEDQIRDLHRNFSWNTEEEADELQELLKCLLVGTDEAIQMTEYQIILKNEAESWYLKVACEGVARMKDRDPNENCIDILKSVIRKFIENQGNLDEIFSRAWDISYSSLTCDSLDLTMASVVKPLIKQLSSKTESYSPSKSQQENLKLLQVYHTIRHLVEYLDKVTPDHSQSLAVQSYPSWFDDKVILEWFKLSAKKTEPVIKLAVAHDVMEEYDPFLKHGTSVPDVKNIIDEMVVIIWLKLRWEDQLFTHTALLDAIKTCTTVYVKAVAQKMEAANFYWHDHPFTVTRKLCISLSNIHAIHAHMHTLNNRISDVMAKAEEENSFAIVDMQHETEFDLVKAVSHAYLAVVKKTIDKLCDYVEQNLETFYRNLKIEPFTIMLRVMWVACVEILYYGFKNSQKFAMFNLANRKKKLSKCVRSTLRTLYNVFYCRGRGLTHYEMVNSRFKKLALMLEC